MIARHDYAPYGQEISAGVGDRTSVWGASDNVKQKFTGQERDTETNLDFFQARYMSAGLGRFMSPDPGNAGADPTDPQTWNAYAYVRGNPTIYTDPSGSCSVLVAGANQGFEQGSSLDKIGSSLGAYQAYPYAGQAKLSSYLYAIGATFGSNSATATALAAITSALGANAGKIDIVTFSGGAAAFTAAYGGLSASDQARIGDIVHLSPALAGAVAVNGSTSILRGTGLKDVVAMVGTEIPLGTPTAEANCAHTDTNCFAEAAAQQLSTIRANGPCNSSAIFQSGAQPSRGSASSTIIYGLSPDPSAFGGSWQPTYGEEGNYTGSVFVWSPGPARPNVYSR